MILNRGLNSRLDQHREEKMKAISKNSNSNTALKKPATKVTTRDLEKSFERSPWLVEYFGSNDRMRPVPTNIIDRIAYELVEWAKSDERYTINSFLFQKGIPKKTFYEWIERYSELKFAHEMFMLKMSDKREVGALTRKLDPSTAYNSLGKYDEEWRDYLKWKASLNDPDGQHGNITVNVQSNSTDFQFFQKWKEEQPDMYQALLVKMKEEENGRERAPD